LLVLINFTDDPGLDAPINVLQPGTALPTAPTQNTGPAQGAAVPLAGTLHAEDAAAPLPGAAHGQSSANTAGPLGTAQAQGGAPVLTVPLQVTVSTQGTGVPLPGTAQVSAALVIPPGNAQAQGAAPPVAGAAHAQGIVNAPAPLAGVVHAHGTAAPSAGTVQAPVVPTIPLGTAIQPTVGAQGAGILPGAAHAHGAVPAAQSTVNNTSVPLPNVQGLAAAQAVVPAPPQGNLFAHAISSNVDMSNPGPRYPASMLGARRGTSPVVLITDRQGEHYISSTGAVLRAPAPGAPLASLPPGVLIDLVPSPRGSQRHVSQAASSQSSSGLPPTSTTMVPSTTMPTTMASASSTPPPGPTPMQGTPMGQFSSPRTALGRAPAWTTGSHPAAPNTAAPGTVAPGAAVLSGPPATDVVGSAVPSTSMASTTTALTTTAPSGELSSCFVAATTPIQQAPEDEDSDDIYGVTPPRQPVNRATASAHPGQPATALPADEASDDMEVSDNPPAQSTFQLAPDEMEVESTSQVVSVAHQPESAQQSSPADVLEAQPSSQVGSDAMEVQSTISATAATTGPSMAPPSTSVTSAAVPTVPAVPSQTSGPTRPVRSTRNQRPIYSLKPAGGGGPEDPGSSDSDEDAGEPERGDKPEEKGSDNSEQGDESQDNGSDAAPRNRRGKGKERAPTNTGSRAPAGSLVAPGRNASTMQSEFETLKERFDVLKNPALHYADKTRRLLHDSTLLQTCKPYERDAPARLLEDYLLNDPMPGSRPWRWILPDNKVQTNTDDAWVVSFVCGTGNTRLRLTGSIPYSTVPEHDPQASANIKKVADTTAKLLQRVPYTQSQNNFVSTVLKVVSHAELHTPKRLTQPYVKNDSIRTRIRHIDPDDGTILTTDTFVGRFWFASKNIEDIPDVESSCVWQSGRSHVLAAQVTNPDGTLSTPSCISPEDVARLGPDILKAEKWARFVAYATTDRIVSVAGLKSMIHDLEEAHNLQNTSPQGVYGGRQLFHPHASIDKRLVFYKFGHAPASDITGVDKNSKLASVKTLDGVLASTPLEVGKKYYLSTGDARIAALYLAEAADLVNEQVLEPQFDYAGCPCDGIMAQTTTHYCQKCLHERYCHTLQLKGNARICKFCRENVDDDSSNVVEKIMTASVTTNHLRECQVMGKDHRHHNEQRRLNDMLNKSKENIGLANSWRDDYAAGQDRILSGVSGVRTHRDPFIPSADAIEAYALSHDETLRYHTMINIAMTSSGFNYMKQRQVIGFLVELAKFDPSRLHKPEEKEEFRLICDQLYLVAVKIPFMKKARFQGRGLSDLSADQAEWRAGRPIPGEVGPWTDVLGRWCLKQYKSDICYYDDEMIERMGGLYDEIQESSGVTLQKAPDGAPWIAPEGGEPCPENWGWGPLSQMMWERERRMVTVCNRHWICKSALPFYHLYFTNCFTQPRIQQKNWLQNSSGRSAQAILRTENSWICPGLSGCTIRCASQLPIESTARP
jgi:hypothetical protein